MVAFGAHQSALVIEPQCARREPEEPAGVANAKPTHLVKLDCRHACPPSIST
jgi:hypothetical protein